VTGLNRFTFGSPDLLSGIPPILVMVGLFAVSEMLVQTGAPGWEKATRESARIRFPTRRCGAASQFHRQSDRLSARSKE
jgi:putative tricarboxylic transport membrane protein